MMGICEGRVAIVTGAGRGLGREYALELARQGARVVVNDLGGAPDGGGSDATPAARVVDEIKSIGGQAAANVADVATSAGARELVQQAVDTFGGLDVVINNAGILRDRMLVNMSEDEWSAVLHVHLDSTYFMSHQAVGYWRAQTKAGQPVDARIINTSSASGLFCNPGQTNYAAAKAGIAAFSVVAAKELGRYGVTVNAIAPAARTRLTVPLMGEAPEGKEDRLDPANVAPLVVWLCSEQAAAVTGRVFEVGGNRITVCNGWSRGPSADNGGKRWDTDALGSVVVGLVADAPAATEVSGS